MERIGLAEDPHEFLILLLFDLKAELQIVCEFYTCFNSFYIIFFISFLFLLLILFLPLIFYNRTRMSLLWLMAYFVGSRKS